MPRVVVVRAQNILSPDARGSVSQSSGTNAKFCQVKPCVLVVRTQNFLSSAARGNVTRGNGARVSVKYAKFSKSSHAC